VVADITNSRITELSLLEKVPKGRKDHKKGRNPFKEIEELQKSPERATDPKRILKWTQLFYKTGPMPEMSNSRIL